MHTHRLHIIQRCGAGCSTKYEPLYFLHNEIQWLFSLFILFSSFTWIFYNRLGPLFPKHNIRAFTVTNTQRQHTHTVLSCSNLTSNLSWQKQSPFYLRKSSTWCCNLGQVPPLTLLVWCKTKVDWKEWVLELKPWFKAVSFLCEPGHFHPMAGLAGGSNE